MLRNLLITLLQKGDSMQFSIYFIIGSVCGSFLNLCADRWFRGASCCWPRSTCNNCHQPVCWYDLIPIINQLWLCQRCRYCKCPLTVDWPLECCAGLLAISGLTLPIDQRLYWWLLCAFYYLLAVMDLRQHAILLGPFLAGSSVCVLVQYGCYHQPLQLTAALIGGIFCYGFAYLSHGLGTGDCDFLVLQCGLFGLHFGLQLLALACGVCLLTYWPLRRYLSRQLPFIPYLVSAALWLLYYRFSIAI